MVKTTPPQVYLHKVYKDLRGKAWKVHAVTHQKIKDKPPIVIHLVCENENVNVSIDVFLKKIHQGSLIYSHQEPRGLYDVKRLKDLPDEFIYFWSCLAFE